MEKALVEHARVEAHVAVDDQDALRLATWAGMRREGVMRGVESDLVVFARLRTDTPVHEPGGFRALLNSFLPRKRAISQMLLRDHDDRVLLCHLTYKQDWDLPGGVVEVGESPQLAVSREVSEELGLTIPAGRLLLTDWLPPVGRMGRRALPGLRRRGPRRGDHRHDRARGPGDPGCRVLHGRPGSRAVRRLHRPSGRGRDRRYLRRRRVGVHRERPLDGLIDQQVARQARGTDDGGRHHQDRAERDQEAQLCGDAEAEQTALVAA